MSSSCLWGAQGLANNPVCPVQYSRQPPYDPSRRRQPFISCLRPKPSHARDDRRRACAMCSASLFPVLFGFAKCDGKHGAETEERVSRRCGSEGFGRGTQQRCREANQNVRLKAPHSCAGVLLVFSRRNEKNPKNQENDHVHLMQALHSKRSVMIYFAITFVTITAMQLPNSLTNTNMNKKCLS